MDDICNSDVLSEVYYVLNLLEKEDYDKIPKDIINFLQKKGVFWHIWAIIFLQNEKKRDIITKLKL